MMAFAPIAGAPVAGQGAAPPPVVSILRGKPRTHLIELAVREGGAETLHRWADRHHFTYPGDEPANTLYEGRAVSPLNVTRTLALTPESSIDGSQSANLVLEDGDGGLDELVDSGAVDGRDARVLVGPAGAALSQFGLVWRGTAKAWRAGDGRVNVTLRDATHHLDTDVQPHTYGGTGGLDGPGELDGKPIPLAYGIVRNVTPVLVDPAYLIYQVHDGPVRSIFGVYDRGAPIAHQGDTTDLYSGSTDAGSYRTDLARGLFQLGSSADGQITADVEGSADPDYVSAIPDIARRVLAHAGLPDQYVQASSFSSLGAAVPAPGGIYLDKRESAKAVLSRLMQGIGGYWFCRRDGRLRVQRLQEPNPAGAVASLDTRNLLELSQRALPASVTPPNRARTVAYQRNWTVMESDIAGAVSDEQQAWLGRQWRTVREEDATVADRHLMATDPPQVASHLDQRADAQDLASHLMALHGTERSMFEGAMPLPVDIEMGDTVWVEWPAYGLSGGRFMRAFPIKEDFGAGRATIVLWG